MLHIDHITTGYGNKQVLSDVSLDVDEKEIVWLNGGNGSGKSTVLKTIFGILHPFDAKGRVIYRGQDITHWPPFRMHELGIAYMPQKHNVFEDLSVKDNLKVALDYCSPAIKNARLEKIFENFQFLKAIQKRTPFHLSGGERQLLAFALMAAHSPHLALLDEPFAGMDQANSALLLNQIIRMNQEEDVAFLIVDHRSELFSSIVNKKYQLELGRIIL